MTSVEASVASPRIEDATLQRSDEAMPPTVEYEVKPHLAVVTDIGSRAVVTFESLEGDDSKSEEKFNFREDADFLTESIKTIRQALYATIGGDLDSDMEHSIAAMVQEADRRFDTQSAQAIGGHLLDLVLEVDGKLGHHPNIDPVKVAQSIHDEYLKIIGIEKRGKIITGAIDIVHKVGGGTVRAFSHLAHHR